MTMASLLCTLKGMFNWVVENLFSLLDLVLSTLLILLPKSPFDFTEKLEWGEFGRLVGYFIPVQKMLYSFSMLLISIGLYYGIRHLLRLVRTVKS